MLDDWGTPFLVIPIEMFISSILYHELPLLLFWGVVGIEIILLLMITKIIWRNRRQEDALWVGGN